MDTGGNTALDPPPPQCQLVRRGVPRVTGTTHLPRHSYPDASSRPETALPKQGATSPDSHAANKGQPGRQKRVTWGEVDVTVRTTPDRPESFLLGERRN